MENPRAGLQIQSNALRLSKRLQRAGAVGQEAETRTRLRQLCKSKSRMITHDDFKRVSQLGENVVRHMPPLSSCTAHEDDNASVLACSSLWGLVHWGDIDISSMRMATCAAT